MMLQAVFLGVAFIKNSTNIMNLQPSKIILEDTHLQMLLHLILVSYLSCFYKAGNIPIKNSI